jgi:hypothetical protein
MVKLLYDAGADVTIRSVFEDESLLEYAERKGHAEIINVIKESQ